MKSSLYQQLLNKSTTITIIGLGYVGLPLALAFAKYFRVVAYDINESRIAQLKQNIDPSREIASSQFLEKDIFFTSNPDDIAASKIYIITVPTPIDVYNLPDLQPLKSASNEVGKVLKKGDYVVYESTVYPGCTEEDCLPELIKENKFRLNQDFKLGYSPERINPGDTQHTLEKNIKLVSSSDEESLEQLTKIYSQIVTAGIHQATSIRVAEAAKIIENTQRDLNIALMNELALIFDKMGINTHDVLEAAATKWNFQAFSPGLVGGHCIGVDPYYLTYKAKKVGYNPNVILSGRYVNDGMGAHVAKKTMQLMLKQGKTIQNARVLVLGATFKENIHDVRTSRVVDILHELADFGVCVEVHDPYASQEDFRRYYGFELIEQLRSDYDAIVVAVAHKEFTDLEEDFFIKHSSSNPLLIDVKGIYRKKIKKLLYWSL
ncbi:MAG: nucleotide sugar dehydrogenase [Cytophagales bacterium]|nr:MAG: nucleotide sugar dehydrogenase [Cytophagales bacterium]